MHPGFHEGVAATNRSPRGAILIAILKEGVHLKHRCLHNIVLTAWQ